MTTARTQAIREALRSPLRSASFLARAWAAAFAVEGSLRIAGYKRTVGWIEAVPRPSGRARRLFSRRWSFGSRERALRAEARRSKGGTSVVLGERLVRAAYRALPFTGGCLPQSLVQYLLHLRDGTGARLVVGVRRPANESTAPSIEAHAWVESTAATPGNAPAGAVPFAPIFVSGEPR